MSDAESFPQFDAALARLKRWGLRLLALLVVVGVVLALLNVAVSVEVNRLWYASVGAGDVYSTILRTQVILFVLFGGIAGVLGGLTAWAVGRTTPLTALDEDPEEVADWRRWFRRHRRGVRRLLVLLAVVVPAVQVGRAAVGGWQAWQLWRHATPWGVTDPTYGRDVSYYVEIYPFHRLVITLLVSAATWAFWVAVVTAVQHGGLRLRGPGRVSRGVIAVVSVVGALYLVGRAGGFWLDRFALVTSTSTSVTGPSYTDLHAVGPGKIVLVVGCAVLAVLLLANAVAGRFKVLAAVVVVSVAGSLVVGSAWPALVYRLKEQPSASTVELPHIAHNIAATSTAFGLGDNVSSSTYGGSQGKQLHGSALQTQAQNGAQLRILDPNKLTPTFNVKQQLQAYYGFKSTLDVDRYPLDGASRDVAIAARELKVGNVSLNSWTNKHLVYTHGYGVVAAPTDSLNSKSEVPKFLDGGMPPSQEIKVDRPQIYFGQSSPNYSIVGQPAGSSAQIEFDHPGGDGTAAAHTTYDGGGGIAIGSTFRRLLFAANLRDPNILFSKGVNSGSRILTVRDPRQRVAQVAPWLRLDGDVYPAVVDGHIEWIVDGYTSTSNYPDSQLVNLHNATTSTLTTNGASTAQPNVNVNYLRNSVKATVDAYTGQVTLYEWNQQAEPDPLLKVWESVFPGLVKPQSDMSADLVAHVRYPQDLFDVQRMLLTKYHVTDPADFYSGNDFWTVPTDPTVAATAQLNAGAPGTASGGPTLPSTYMSMSSDGFGPATFSLSSPLVTLNKQDLAGFITVNSTPGADYGKLTLLQFPPGATAGSPSQVQNDIESNTTISQALTLERGGNSKVVLGNLLTLPMGGQMLYVEPIYTQATSGSSFPILRHVVAIYGGGDPAFTSDLDTALKQALASGDSKTGAGAGSGTGSGTGSGSSS